MFVDWLRMGKKLTISTLIALIAVAYNFYVNRKILGPILETKLGKLQGIVTQSRNGQDVHEYLGIPFAKAPVGDLRFEVRVE